MATREVAVTLDERTVAEVDRWVREGRYPNRSRAMQAALEEMTRRWRMERIAQEAAKLDVTEQHAMAEEWVGDDGWPAYWGARSTGPVWTPFAVASRRECGRCW